MSSRALRWDVRTSYGAPVTDLATLSAALGTDRRAAAKALFASPAVTVAPVRVREQAYAELKKAPKPGGGTPPPIDTGSFVQWGSNRGRVDLIVTSGKVPGVDDDVEGSKDSPAARVVVWDKDGDGYKPSRKRVAHMVHTLRRIPPLQRRGKAAPREDPVSLLSAHHGRGLPEYARVSGAAVKAVYERGLAGWPGYRRTTLSRRQWAVGRVKAFLAVAAGDEPGTTNRDLELLSKAHPRHPEHKLAGGSPYYQQPRRDDVVEVDRAEITRALAMFDVD